MKWLKEMRVPHYLKNILIFVPLIFNGSLLEINLLISAFLGFISFCAIASVVYIINDIKDIEKDRMHETKKNRPIASGAIPIGQAKILAIILFIIGFGCSMLIYVLNGNRYGILVLAIYFCINLLYSLFQLKKVPLLDVIILAFCYYLRVEMGAVVTDIVISSWLYLVIISGAFYMGFGKRRNELVKGNGLTRDVLTKYNKEFLDKSMYSCMTLTIMFFSLWCLEKNELSERNYLILVPVLMIICFKYSMDIESIESDGDPMSVILKDKVLLLLAAFFGVLSIALLYSFI